MATPDPSRTLPTPAAAGAAAAEAIIAPTSITSKRVVYVGGLSDKANAAGLRSAFLPFGPLQSVDVPMDYAAGKHRGFAFVEFKSAEDAVEAVFNMDGAEYLGRVLRVSLAQQNQVNKLQQHGSTAAGTAAESSSSYRDEAIWKSDDWYQKHIVEGGTDHGDNDAAAANQQAADERQQDIKALR